MQNPDDLELSRRNLLIATAASVALMASPAVAYAQSPAANAPAAAADVPSISKVSFTVNGRARDLELDTRKRCLTRCVSGWSCRAPRKGAITVSAARAQ